jgi:hypothetical protein
LKGLLLLLLPPSAGIKPEQVDILVTSTSIFCPTPSLASMLVNQVKLRSDIQAYHLGGMGCSNGVVGVGLVRDLLQVRLRDGQGRCRVWAREAGGGRERKKVGCQNPQRLLQPGCWCVWPATGSISPIPESSQLVAA